MAWKCNQRFEPIGADRIFDAPNSAYVLKLLAYEENIEYDPNRHGKKSLILPNGDRWNVRIL